jgi:ABC-2 type transport system ATP-binding protein
MISTHDLSKCFDRLWAVDGVNLHIDPGEVLALLGPNGAGKTTIVRMLTSILNPTRGTAIVAGYDILEQPREVRAAVGVLTEHHGLYTRMPADEYLDFYGQVYDLSAKLRAARIDKLLRDFGLYKDRHRRIGEYSKGMRQKLALARALLHDPPVLLLDEPTSAMDPESSRLVRDAINELRSASRTIIICTHNLVEAEELADQVAIIQSGKIISHGTPHDLKTRYFGSTEYEVRFAARLDDQKINLPDRAVLVARGKDWLHYQTNDADHINPLVLQHLLASGLPVISLQEVAKSIEHVYLHAVGQSTNSS